MYDKSNKQLTFILYDGIENSVFESMVLFPLLSMLNNSSNLEITLISFEKKIIGKPSIMRRIPAHDRLHLVLCHRLPFLGKLSLWLSSFQLKKILHLIPSHQLITRGPLAGWITIKTLERLAKKNPERLRANYPDPLPPLTVQSRGLCAEEYRYTYDKGLLSWIKLLYRRYIYNQLNKIEFEVYRNKRKTDIPDELAIEAVSPALKEHLVQNFRADPTKITISTYDLPQTISADQKAEWRKEVRTELAIPETAYVYTYGGSTKPWQCIPQMMAYFSERLKENSEAIFLILTQDKKEFESSLQRSKILPKNYRIYNAGARDVYKYLSAADAGLLFRHNDVINWVSRPTKMLEYQAVGLEIIHNDTIAWLCKKE